MQTSHRIALTAAQRKVVAELMPELADWLLLDTQNQRTLPFTLDELQSIQQKAHEAIHHAETGMIRNSLRHIIEATTKAIDDSQGIGSIPSSGRLYQFKITLLESQPPIWRRIQVKNCTLDKLHERIQTAMGWTNSHLHQFEIDGERFGDPELLDDGFEDFECVDSTVTKISDIIPKDGKRFRFLYEYDFGDDWEHEVLFEGCLNYQIAGPCEVTKQLLDLGQRTLPRVKFLLLSVEIERVYPFCPLFRLPMTFGVDDEGRVVAHNLHSVHLVAASDPSRSTHPLVS